jgi:peptidoglycan/LPS O-acetylase OafA/YrhL
VAQQAQSPPRPSPEVGLEPNLAYIPALDGVRALAVAGVMAFHSGIPFLPAGFLGVDAFFVLSGFLITTLLLGEWGRRVTIGLRVFWARRARRLLPALLLVILFVTFYGAFVAPSGTYPDLRLDALSTLFYVANWHFIGVGTNYFVQTGPVSLLTHTWSLAIEEQFYLVWPLVVLGVLKMTRNLRVLLAICVCGAAASALEMALLYHPGSDPTRLYYGTDTHAQSLLVGAALAVVLALIAERRRASTTMAGGGPSGGDSAWAATSRRGRIALAMVGTVGAATTAVMWWRVSYTGSFLWDGGFLVVALSMAAVLACVVCHRGSWLAGALSVGPMRFLGRISYGLYLWHFPLFQWLDGERTGLTGYPLFGVRCAATVAVATASFYMIESPIRTGAFLSHWRAWVATPFAVAGVAAAVVVTTVGSGAVSAAGIPAHPPPIGAAIGRPAATASTPIGAAGPSTVLLVGDSVAVTFGYGLGVDASRYRATLINEGIVECGVAEVTEVNSQGNITPPGIACRPTIPASQQWPAQWAGWITTDHPSVVAIVAGRWEVSDVEWNGQWTNILSAPFAAYVRQQLQLAVNIASSQGAHVALFTAPCYDNGEQSDGEPWPADGADRLDVYNGIVRAVVADNPATTNLVDLDSVVCPGGRFEATIDGVTVRAPDGVHFPWDTLGNLAADDPDNATTVTQFGEWLGPKVWPEILDR